MVEQPAEGQLQKSQVSVNEVTDGGISWSKGVSEFNYLGELKLMWAVEKNVVENKGDDRCGKYSHLPGGAINGDTKIG